MSVTGVSTSSAFQDYALQNGQNNFQQIQSEFQQLGQALQAGNLSQAQEDFATLTQNAPSNASGTQQNTNSNSPLSQAFSALGQALQSGNLSAAQQDFATIQQDAQQQRGSHSFRHHHAGSAGSQSAQDSQSSQSNPIAQDFSSLAQALQSGNLSAAQSAFTALEEGLQQFQSGAFGSTSATGTTSQTSSNALSVTG
jgi:outer membrane protein assembly factor BamD (BamD/ComL family)